MSLITSGMVGNGGDLPHIWHNIHPFIPILGGLIGIALRASDLLTGGE